MWIHLQIVLWICHISNFSVFATTQDVLHLCECAADVTSSLRSYIWCKSSEKLIRETDSWTLSSATLFTGKKIQSGICVRLENTKMKHLIFHVVFFYLFLRVTVWPNLFFWACRGRAAHPANMTEEVWSLLSNLASPTLCPHSCSSLEFAGGVDVTRCHRQGQIEASRLQTCYR